MPKPLRPRTLEEEIWSANTKGKDASFGRISYWEKIGEDTGMGDVGAISHCVLVEWWWKLCRIL
jgi:hypothetical protein